MVQSRHGTAFEREMLDVKQEPTKMPVCSQSFPWVDQWSVISLSLPLTLALDISLVYLWQQIQMLTLVIHEKTGIGVHTHTHTQGADGLRSR